MEYTREDLQAKIQKSATTFLARWNGGTARLYELTTSHPCLTLRVTQRGEGRGDMYLTIACFEPEWIQGPREWDDCRIEVLSHQRLRSGEEGFRVVDGAVGLEIETPTIEVKECRYRAGRKG